MTSANQTSYGRGLKSWITGNLPLLVTPLLLCKQNLHKGILAINYSLQSFWWPSVSQSVHPSAIGCQETHPGVPWNLLILPPSLPQSILQHLLGVSLVSVHGVERKPGQVLPNSGVPGLLFARGHSLPPTPQMCLLQFTWKLLPSEKAGHECISIKPLLNSIVSGSI